MGNTYSEERSLWSEDDRSDGLSDGGGSYADSDAGTADEDAGSATSFPAGTATAASCSAAPIEPADLARLVPLLLSHLRPPPLRHVDGACADGAPAPGAAAAFAAAPHQQLRLVCRGARTAVDAATLRLAVRGDRQLRCLIEAADRFRSLRALTIIATSASDLRALADAAPALGDRLPALCALTIAPHPRASGFDDATPAAIALASKLCALPKLARFAARLPSLPYTACDALISVATCLPDLESFELLAPAGPDGSDALAAALARSNTWSGLRELSLTSVDACGLDALAAAAQLTALTSLALRDCVAVVPASSDDDGASNAHEEEEEEEHGDAIMFDDDGWGIGAGIGGGIGGGGQAVAANAAAAGGGDDGGAGMEEEQEEDAGEDDDVWRLASAPWWPQLRALTLDGCSLTDLGPLPPCLELLSLRDNRLGDTAARLLAAAPLPRLRVLRLDDNPDISARGAAALAAAPWLQRLGGAGTASSGYATPASSSRALAAASSQGTAAVGASGGGLTELSLGGCRIGGDGVAAIAAAPGVRRLRRLDVSSAGATDGALAALAAADLESLEELDLSGGDPGRGPLYNTRLGRDGYAWRKLAAAPLWSLRRLDLRRVLLGAEAAGALASAPWLARLDALLLPDSIDGDALDALTGGAPFARLEAEGRVVYGDGGIAGAGGRPQRRSEEWADAGALFEEAMGAAAVAAAATAAVALALSVGGRR